MQTETANGDPAASRIPPSGLGIHAALVSRILQSAVSLFQHLRDCMSAHPIGNHNSRDMEITA
jgi:hypothetical protein